MDRHTALGSALALLMAACLLALSIPRVGYAAAPNVRIVTPADITIDGEYGDWDKLAADYLADMYEAGKPDKDVLAKLYGRYDCDTLTFYVYVNAAAGWNVVPSDKDNYVKLGQTDKLVDGSDAPGGGPPDFAYIDTTAWEAAFNLDPGSYLGDGGLNVHAQVQPQSHSATAAVADRRLDVVITCPTPTPSPEPTEEPTPEPTEEPTASSTPTVPPSVAPSAPASVSPSASASVSPSASASVSPSASASVSPSAPASVSPSAPASVSPSASASVSPSASASVAPSASASVSPSASASVSPSASASVAPSASAQPSESPTAAPSGSAEPAPTPSPSGSVSPETGEAPIIVAKVNDRGTNTRDDDRLVGGARFEIRLDDGDGAYEPNGDDGAPVAELDAPDGYAVYEPSEAGDYWVKEVKPPKGFTTARAELVSYNDSASNQNCAVFEGETRCRPDDDNTGGMTLAVIADSPKGQDLPRTDTEPMATARPSVGTITVLIAGLAGAVAAAAFVMRTSRPRPE